MSMQPATWFWSRVRFRHNLPWLVFHWGTVGLKNSWMREFVQSHSITFPGEILQFIDSAAYRARRRQAPGSIVTTG